MVKKEKNKRGQITIFIIIGLVLVAMVILLLLFMTDLGKNIISGKETNPNSFLSSCLEYEVKDAIKLISEQGGYVENDLSVRFKFEGEPFRDISYLCYNEFPGEICTIQEGDLIGHLKTELKDDIEDDVEDCLLELELKLKEEYDVVEVDKENFEFDIELVPRKVHININAEMVLTKSGKTSRIDGFNVRINSMFYDLAVVVHEILSDLVIQECEFEDFDYMTSKIDVLFYNKEMDGDFIKFYTVIYKDTEERFRFAVKNCG